MSDSYRGFGIGSEILKNGSQVAMKCHCNSMHFLVAECNVPSPTKEEEVLLIRPVKRDGGSSTLTRSSG
jgi:hypothetical protein